MRRMPPLTGSAIVVIMLVVSPTDAFAQTPTPEQRAEVWNRSPDCIALPLRDAPFSAEAVTVWHPSANSGRTELRVIARYYRDRAGRVRVDFVGGNTPQRVFITGDADSHVTYLLGHGRTNDYQGDAQPVRDDGWGRLLRGPSRSAPIDESLRNFRRRTARRGVPWRTVNGGCAGYGYALQHDVASQRPDALQISVATMAPQRAPHLKRLARHLKTERSMLVHSARFDDAGTRMGCPEGGREPQESRRRMHPPALVELRSAAGDALTLDRSHRRATLSYRHQSRFSACRTRRRTASPARR